MNRIILITSLVSILCLSCGENTTTEISSPSSPVDTKLEIPEKIVDHSTLQYNRKTSIWTLNDQLYSGYSVSFFEDGTQKEKFGILNGKKQNQATQWFADGHYKQLANYHQGKLHGEKKTWSSDSTHVLIAHLNYHSGKAHGEQKKWYPTGELFKKLNLDRGRESGIQQAFRKNGDLFANYEAREGRIFGLKKAALCFGLEDENIQYEK